MPTNKERMRHELFAIVVSYGRDSSHGTDETLEAVEGIISYMRSLVRRERNGNFSTTPETESYNFAIDRILAILGDKQCQQTV